MQPSDPDKSMIRPFRVVDIDKVYEIECKSFPFPWSRFLFKRLHYKNPQGFLVAARNGEAIGYGIVEIMKRRGLKSELKRFGHLLNLAVDPPFRCQGVGGELVSALILYLQGKRVEDFLLEVRVSNSVARNFYSKLGFKEVGQKILYYWNEDAVVMNLRLQKSDNH
ncbi:ribosomal protein S18-alanine N-acetyltransferase [Candidatus Bathyarchaeota archaeon]|nr:ribosomal protein S18-alanine N-acetyltransferase [Candidatus Bathyarchaeota archaeon]